jgi:hypothetical protein
MSLIAITSKILQLTRHLPERGFGLIAAASQFAAGSPHLNR